MLIAHILGDFYFQTDKIASEKDNSLNGVIIHAIEYTFSVFLMMLPVINSNYFDTNFCICLCCIL